MGRIIAEKVRGMNWTAKISLVLIFTLVFSTFMQQGLYKPNPADAAITNQQAWTNVYHSATLPGASAASFAVSAGSNRMLVVAITAEGSSSGTYTYTSVQYGGQTMTLANGDGGTSLSQHTLLFYLKDHAVMDGTAKTLAVNGANFGGTDVMHNIWYAVYAGVDQAATPVSRQYNSGGTAVTSAAWASALPVNANEQAVLVACAARAGSAVTWNAPTNWTKGNNQPTGNTGLGFVAYRTIPGTDTTDTASATGITSSRVSMTGMSMAAAAGDQVNVADGTDPANYTVYVGDTDKVADGFTMAASADTAEVTAVTASLTNSSNVSGIRLYRDAGTIGTYDAGVDTLISTGTPGATVNFTGLTESLTTTATNYLIVVDIASGATPGQTVVATVTGLTVTAPDSEGTVTDSGTTLTVGTPQMTVSGLADYPAPASVQQAQNNAAMMKFTLATNAGSVTWTGGTLDKIGTNGQLGAVVYDIYLDANGNGTFESGSDTIILTADPFTLATADPYTLTTSQTITTTPKTYFIVYDISASATTTTTVGARIAGNAYFTVTGGTVAGATSTSSGTPTINAGTCVRSAPTVDMGGNGTASPGGNKVYTVTVTNNDNSFCSSSAFTLSLASETGNTGSFSLPSSLAPTTTGVLAPGAAYSGTTLTVVAQAGATIGHTLTTTINAADATNHAAQTGSGAVTTTVIVPWANNPMLHNSTNLNSTKWGANGWGIPGGKYGAFTCETCHTKATTNIKRIKTTITVPDTSQGNIPGSTVNFQTITTPNGFGDNNLTHATSQRICEVCHTATTYHKYNQTAINHEMPNGNTDCTYCHPHSQGFKPIGCTDCHAQQQGSRAAVIGQFSGNSHHVQGVALTNQHCYQCHWEAKSDGSVNGAYHGGWVASGSAVDLVIYGAGTRPTTYTLGTTAVAYTANGTRTELLKINQVCLGCHDDDTATAQPFGDGKTPKQYAWDGSSVNSRYTQPTGTTTWGKYSGANVTPKNTQTKAYSAHGNAVANQRGWNTSETWPNTANGAVNVLCFDCHNSHGSTVAGTTTSYTSATTNGAILKDTTAGVGGYSVTYKPVAGGSVADKNPHNPGAALCFDCHMTQNAGTKPWGYQGTFGATQAIVGYWEKPYWYGAAGVNPSGAQQRYAYKNLVGSQGGHLSASSSLGSAVMGTIGGLCTPCHDPHGVSTTDVGYCSNTAYVTKSTCTSNGGTWTASPQFGVPLLKGTWVTSPYKEDAAPLATNEAKGGGAGRSGENPLNVGSTPGYHLDQNTFRTQTTTIPTWNFYSLTSTSTDKITQTAAQFGGLCLQCHPQTSINPDGGTGNKNTAWQGYDRIHNTVQGWGGQGANASNAIHGYTCSKCHTPHNSCLPRLMITNCLDYKHRGRVASTGTVRTGTNTYTGRQAGNRGRGNGRYPGGGGGYGDEPEDWNSGGGAYFFGIAGTSDSSYPAFRSCHDTPNGGTWPNNQQWNTKTPW